VIKDRWPEAEEVIYNDPCEEVYGVKRCYEDYVIKRYSHV